MADLVLDKDVRNWVLIPLTLAMFLFMLIRQYATSVSRLQPSDHAVYSPLRLCTSTVSFAFVLQEISK